MFSKWSFLTSTNNLFLHEGAIFIQCSTKSERKLNFSLHVQNRFQFLALRPRLNMRLIVTMWVFWKLYMCSSYPVWNILLGSGSTEWTCIDVLLGCQPVGLLCLLIKGHSIWLGHKKKFNMFPSCSLLAVSQKAVW